MTRKGLLEGREPCDPLLTERGEITANATEHGHHLCIQVWLVGCFGSLHLGFHREQQLFHLPGPGLLEFFFDEGELTQMMHIAPGLREGVALIALPSIMAAFATKLWRNANGIQRFAPATGM